MPTVQGYIGRAPGDSSIIIARQTFEPTGVQTNFTFTVGYTPGYLDVYYNGAKLITTTDYTASDGSTVGLTTYANNGDILELVAYKAYNVNDVTAAATNFSVGSAITMFGNSGIVSATSYYGSAENLTNISSATAVPGINTTGHSVFNTLNATGIATFAGGTSSGALSVTDTTASTSTSTGALIVSGGVGIAKSLFVGEGISIAGTITYNDVTNIDSIGIVTAGKGFRATTGGLIVTAGVSTFAAALDVNSSADISGGVNLSGGNLKVTSGIVTVGTGVTVSSDFIHLTDNSKIQLGIASDLAIYHDGTNSYISNGTGDLRIDPKSGERGITLAADGAATLYHDNTAKIETVGTGVSIFGGMKVQSGLLRESVNIVANKLSAAPTINVDNGMMHYFTTQETTTTKPNIISSAGINTDMAIGDTMCLTIITTAAAAGYSFDWRVDGVIGSAGVTSSWVGGSAPSAGNGSGLDTYNLTFIKTGNAAYTMIGNLVNSA